MQISYQNLLRATILGLLIFVAALSLILYNRGPRVRLVSFDADPAESALFKNTSLTISFDRPIEQRDYIGQINFTPQLDFTIGISNQSITVFFEENFRHDVDYTLEVGPEIYDQTGQSMSSIFKDQISISTPAYAYLQRSHEPMHGPDQIMLARVGQEPEVIFSQFNISQFAMNGEYLLVAIRGERADVLNVMKLDSKETSEVRTNVGGVIDNLALSPRGKTALYTISPNTNS